MTFQHATALFEQGDLVAAEPLFLAVAAQYPELSDHALAHLARIAERRGDAATALARWQSLERQQPDSVWSGEAALAIGRASLAAGDSEAAGRWLADARGRLPDGPALAEALWLSSRAARERGDALAAHELARSLRRRFPSTAEAALAREQAWEERESTSLTSAKDLEEEMTLLLDERDGLRALELGRLGSLRFATDADLPEIRRLAALALLRTGDREAGLAALEDVLSRFPAHPAASRALYRLAQLAWNADDDARALRLFQRLAAGGARTASAAEALYAIGRIHQEAGHWKSAAAAFENLARRHPRSNLAGEARWRVAWCAYRANDRRRAATLFAAVAKTHSTERASALYWRDRARGDGAYAELLREFPESYYARLAEDRLGRSGGSLLPARESNEQGSSAPLCPSDDPHRLRFEELRSIGLLPLARRELTALQRSADGCDAYLIRAWTAVAGYRQATAQAQRAGGCSWQSPWIDACYPRVFWDTVQADAERRGLDPYLVLAVVRQESLFDPEARSVADARGLMQILPSTGARVAKNLGWSNFSVEHLATPDANLALGTAYLADLLERYGGDVARAVAAYNAGEGAVDKWQRRYAGLGDDEFVESLSFRETRQYVKRVLANQRIYRAVYLR